MKIIVEPGWKNILSACLGILVGLLVILGITANNSVITCDMTKAQNQLLNITICALLISSFTVVITFIIPFLFFRFYYIIRLLHWKIN